MSQLRGQEEKWATENEIVGWHHQAYGHEFEQAPGVLQSMGLQRVGHNIVNKKQQQKIYSLLPFPIKAWVAGTISDLI